MKNAKKTMNVALIAFVDGDERILLNRRADAESEMWEFIGGGIEPGETALQAIIREVSEEIGYNLNEDSDDLQFMESFDFENEKIIAQVHIFKATYPGLDNFSDSDETRVEDLHLFAASEALELVLLPMSLDILTRNVLFED